MTMAEKRRLRKDHSVGPRGTDVPSQRRCRRIAVLLFCAGFCLCPEYAAAQSVGEYEIKAAFLYNFARFTDWPDEADHPQDPFTFCILGEDPFGGGLEATTRGKSVHGRPVAVEHLGTAPEGRSCRVVFIAPSEHKQLGKILDALDGSSALTVGDSEGFSESGVMINLVVEDRQVRFEVNAEAARHAGLRLSSRLLELARVVNDNGR